MLLVITAFLFLLIKLGSAMRTKRVKYHKQSNLCGYVWDVGGGI